ncbi:hypothetical protein BT96DRAFT_951451 [Gymnopus androsaceus JB14]|uniref:Altered inheritance of mitochondria protein 41 n=1 Tax=Gymnopus androsaceus JB14 TaxID=1447944 RepID=A0A6A4GD23_9AGAR|nr:hypothetical protein BT96DRAFT_951451 [Gymnopus androsaceus JB14]
MFGYKYLPFILVALTMISSQAQAAAIPQGNVEARDATAVTKRSPNVNVDSEALMSREPAVEEIALSRRGEAEKLLIDAIKEALKKGALSPKLKKKALKLFGSAAEAAAATGEPESVFQ